MPRNLEEIPLEEREYFDKMYCALKDQFPKECACGRVYENELEYNSNTSTNVGNKKSRIWDASEMGMYLFLRNCDCGSTLSLGIDREKFDEDNWADFIGYINGRAKKENRTFLDVFQNEVAEEYHQYLEDKLKE